MGSTADILLVVILLLPLVGGVFAYIVKSNWAGTVMTAFAGLILVFSIDCYFVIVSGYTLKWAWFNIGEQALGFGLIYDRLSGIMLITVSIVSFMVTMFSIEYMRYDEGKNRYFGLLGLFVFSMFGIVLSSSLLMTFIFWELVGFSSYLLIGFWFEKEEPPISSFRAFMTNRIGDAGFLLALFIAFAYFKTFDIQEIIEYQSTTNMPISMVHLLGIGLFMAAMGKSAQFPLQTWLPHAMTGPTPVSALIHAATMVAAGVYFMVRIFPILSVEVLNVIALVGGVTAFMGAFAAFAQNDIKKVLAFSTVSQLGYMMIAVGSGRPDVAFFHLTTHAFFKAALFLCAGSIIHKLHEQFHNEPNFDAQDMRNMGGLKAKMPFTFIAYTVSMLALCGLPLFSGFFSKEAIIASSFHAANIGFSNFQLIVPFFAIATVLMTATYMGRQYFLVFFGKFKFDANITRWKESLLIIIPILLLSTFSLWFWFGTNPVGSGGAWLIRDLLFYQVADSQSHQMWITTTSIGLAVLGLIAAFLIYYQNKTSLINTMPHTLIKLSSNHWYLDDIHHFLVIKPTIIFSNITAQFDQRVVDGIVNGLGVSNVVLAYLIGWFDRHVVDGVVTLAAKISMNLGNVTRGIQGGKVQLYFVWAILGFLVIFILMT